MKRSFFSWVVLFVFGIGSSGLAAEVGAPVDVTLPGDAVEGVPNNGANSNGWPANETPPMAIDDDVNYKYLHFLGETQPTGFQVTPSRGGTVVGEITLTTANDAPERDPISFMLYGSNVSINGPWTVIASGPVEDFNGETSWPRFTKNTTPIRFDNYTLYDHYQLLFTAVRNRPSASICVQIGEVELIERPLANYPPSVEAGDSRVLFEPENRYQLDGSVTDDGKGDPNGYLAMEWSQIDGPGAVEFEPSAFVERPFVTLVELGTYKFQLWASDGEKEASDTVTIVLNESIYPEGDIDGDYRVGLGDLVGLAQRWLDGSGSAADLDGDGDVDGGDFGILAANWNASKYPLVINEFMARNGATIADDQGEYDDWIELYNLLDVPLDLAGMYLTDDLDEPTKWRFPAGRGDETIISGNGYLLVWADEDVLDEPGLHASFGLEADFGQEIGLFDKDGISLIDSIEFGGQVADVSFGREPEGSENWFTLSPTPGWSNIDSYLGVIDEVGFSYEHGFYDGEIEVTLSCGTADVSIRYTTDYSAPTLTNGTTYTAGESISINKTTCLRAGAFKAGWKPPLTGTQTYIYLDDVISQGAAPAGFPAMWGTVEADYGMDPDVVNDPEYGPKLRSSLLSLPTLSIVTETDNLFESSRGIYPNPLMEGTSWESPVSVEYFSFDDAKDFQIDCGMRIQGGAFRRFDLTRKKSFRLLFKKEYGAGKLEFPLFDYDKGASESFDTITLRGGSNDGYSWSSARLTEQYIRDEFGRSLQRATGNAGSHGTFMHLYLNGLYWGLYNAVERPDNSFSSTYYGGSKEDWDASNTGSYTNGDGSAWNSLLGKCRAGLEANSAYQEIMGNNPDGSRNPAYPVMIDTANYIDYLTINMWGGNGDWPHRNYWMGRLRGDESAGFKFYCWDYEGTIATPFAVTDKVSSISSQGVGEPHSYLKANAEYRLLFGDRLHRMFFNDGCMVSASVVGRYSELADWVEDAIVAESARWGDMHHHPPLGHREWVTKRDGILTSYLPTRSDVVLAQMRNNGFYPNVEAPVFKVDGSYQHGGYVETEAVLSLFAPTSVSYTNINYVDEGALVRAHVPMDDSLGPGWTAKEFVPDALTWTDGSTTTGVGYERGGGYESWIGTNVDAEMNGVSTSVFCRIEFENDGVETPELLELQMRYDDGFIAYLNGVEICRSNNITNETPGSAEAGSHEAGSVYEVFPISEDKLSSLVVGRNVLAVHGINISLTSSDMIVSPKLIGKIAKEATTPGQWYTTNGEDPRLFGSGINPDASEYSIPLALSESVRIKSRTLNDGQWSALNESVYAVGAVAENLRVTELMYNPQGGGDTEFIEIMNIHPDPSFSINLALVRFTNGVDFEFPSLELYGGQRAVVVKDQAAFAARYDTNDIIVVEGEYSGSLSNSGEEIDLKDALGGEIGDFDYKDGWYPITDGPGFSLTIRDARSSDPNDWDHKSGWRASFENGGSPGRDDSAFVLGDGAIRINEVLAHADTIEPTDWVEFYNTTDSAINIGGWFISDSDTNLMKYEIQGYYIIPAHGYAVFYGDRDFGVGSDDPGSRVGFGLSENGERVYLTSGSGGALTGVFSTERKFGASAPDAAFGHYIKSTGGDDFVAMESNSPGEANGDPKIGSIVITEIAYHPLSDDDAEFVELVNRSGSSVTLYDYAKGAAWRFVDGSGTELELVGAGGDPIILARDEVLLLVNDKDRFEAVFGVDLNTLGVQWLAWGPGSGRLSNGGELVEIQKPGDLVGTERMYIRVDRVSYDDEGDWPVEPDGSDEYTLGRKNADGYGNDVINWQEGLASPGTYDW